jgi:hypothetical protein
MQVINDLSEYRAYVRQTDSLPIFFYDWWLDAAASPNGWNGLLLRQGSDIIALWTYAHKKKWGFRKIVMPPTTPYMGCWYELPQGLKTHAALSLEFRILDALLSALPPFDDYHQTFYPTPLNWQPLAWRGFTQTTRYTYRLDLRPELSFLFDNFRPQTRTHIRKAARSHVIVADLEPELFYSLNQKTFQRQGLQISYSLSFFLQKDAALLKQKKRKIFFALNKTGQAIAALYLIWDARAAYLHLMGSDPAQRGADAGDLLVWEAIQFAKTQLGVAYFDFEGSMLQTVCAFFRSFGASPVPYHQITKVNPWLLKTWYFLKLKNISF